MKKYTKHNLKDVVGPVTIVSGKHRRLTFIECPNDLSSMIVRVPVAVCGWLCASRVCLFSFSMVSSFAFACATLQLSNFVCVQLYVLCLWLVCGDLYVCAVA